LEKAAMDMLSEMQWVRISEFLLAVGRVRVCREFGVEISRRIGQLIPHDQSRVYFINDNGKICDEELFGVKKDWSLAYFNYYSKIDAGRWNISDRSNMKYSGGQAFVGKIDWTKAIGLDEFTKYYVEPQRIRSSMGLGLRDGANLKCVVILDRTSRHDFSEKDLYTLRIAQSHLDNLYANLYVDSSQEKVLHMLLEPDLPLTARESEIAGLLRDGLTPTSISRRLSLSLATVYKHISNIHGKFHVSNRQELMLRLLEK
jgi:DNA-binding CsgD family transcriptional regulator